MLNSKVINRNRTGFTLPEVLVAVAMVGILSAVVLPSLIGQISKSEASRVIADIQSTENASQMFRVDVGRWPGNLDHLVDAPVSTEFSADGATAYGSGASLWDGPYLSRADDLTNGMATGAGGTIEETLGITEWTEGSPDRDNFFTITVAGLTVETATLVSLTVDGVEAAGTELTSGKLRYATATEILTYFGSPLK